MNDHRTEQNRTEQRQENKDRTEQNTERTQRIKFLIHGDWKSPHPGSEIHF